jgi:hypothetical protein
MFFWITGAQEHPVCLDAFQWCIKVAQGHRDIDRLGYVHTEEVHVGDMRVAPKTKT